MSLRWTTFPPGFLHHASTNEVIRNWLLQNVAQNIATLASELLHWQMLERELAVLLASNNSNVIHTNSTITPSVLTPTTPTTTNFVGTSATAKMTVPVPATLPVLNRPPSSSLTLRSPSHARASISSLPFSPQHQRHHPLPTTSVASSSSVATTSPPSSSSITLTPSNVVIDRYHSDINDSNNNSNINLNNNLMSPPAARSLTPTPPSMPPPFHHQLASIPSGRSTPTPSSGRVTPTLSGRSTPTSMMRANAPSPSPSRMRDRSTSHNNGNNTTISSTSNHARRALRQNHSSSNHEEQQQQAARISSLPMSPLASQALALHPSLTLGSTRLEPIVSPQHELPLPSPLPPLSQPSSTSSSSTTTLTNVPSGAATTVAATTNNNNVTPATSPQSSLLISTNTTINVVTPRESRASSMINEHQLPSRGNQRAIPPKPRQASLPMTSPRHTTTTSGLVHASPSGSIHGSTFATPLPLVSLATQLQSVTATNNKDTVSTAHSSSTTLASGDSSSLKPGVSSLSSSIQHHNNTNNYTLSLLAQSPRHHRRWEANDIIDEPEEDDDEEDDAMRQERESARLRDQAEAVAAAAITRHNHNQHYHHAHHHHHHHHHHHQHHNGNEESRMIMTTHDSTGSDDQSLDSPNIPLSAAAAFARRTHVGENAMGSLKQPTNGSSGGQLSSRKSRRAPISITLGGSNTNNSNSSTIVRPPPLNIPDTNDETGDHDTSSRSISQSHHGEESHRPTLTTIAIAPIAAATATTHSSPSITSSNSTTSQNGSSAIAVMLGLPNTVATLSADASARRARVPMLSSRRTSWSPKDATRILVRPSTGGSIPARIPTLNLAAANASNSSQTSLTLTSSSSGSEGQKRHRHTMLTPRSLARAVESEDINNVRAVMRMYMTELDLTPVDEVKIKQYLGDPSVLPSSEKAKAAARVEEARASLSASERYEAIATDLYHQQQNARQPHHIKAVKLAWLMGLRCDHSPLGGNAWAKNELFDTSLLALVLDHLNQVEQIDLSALRSTISSFI